MPDARSFATHAVGAAVALVGVALAGGGVILVVRGVGAFLGLLLVLAGLVVLAGAGLFLLVPLKVDELAAESSVRLREK